MALSYDPDEAAHPDPPWNTTLLSERDVALQIPVNFISSAGVSVTAACFANYKFEDYAFARCMSNLLATDFRRFVFDIYWDASASSWSFCPVKIPSRLPIATSSRHTTSSPTGAPRAASSIAALNVPVSPTARSTISSITQTVPTKVQHFDRAATAVITSSIVSEDYSLGALPAEVDTSGQSDEIPTTLPPPTTVTIGTTTSGNSTYLVRPTAVPTGLGEVLYSIGPYLCTDSISLTELSRVLLSYLHATDTTIDADVKYIIFNLHAQATGPDFNATNGPPVQPGPVIPLNQLERNFTDALESYLYTPLDLAQQRVNIDRYWPSTSYTSPDRQYFTVETNVQGINSTDDGWPSISFLETGKDIRRLLVSIDTVSPDLQNLGPFNESDIVFSQGYTAHLVENVTVYTDGSVASGCYFNPATPYLSAVNNSWAIENSIIDLSNYASHINSSNSTFPPVTSLITCGISPVLNQTLLNVTADVNVIPYQEFVFSTVWSWAAGEPRATSAKRDRCAVLEPSLSGRWRVASCDDTYYGACRNDSSPFLWSLTSKSSHYSAVADMCPDNTSFAVPRTPLENRFLSAAYEATKQQQVNTSAPLWINLNSLDVPYCWVIGTNSTCPYVSQPLDTSRQVYVPTVTAVIILILAGLTLMVKVGSNRQQNRSRRKVVDGWSYEGVPA